MKKTTANLLAILAIATLFVACSKEGKEDKTSGTTPPTSAKDRPVQPAPTKAAPAPTMEAMFSEYEAMRSLLANDTGEGVTAHAGTMGTMATALGAKADDTAKPHLAAVADAAAKLGAVDAGDMPALRLAFGEVSRPLVALIGADQQLAAGYHTFECPMAKGFQQWIQPNAELENPYMGQKMLTCGSEVATAD